MFLELMMYLIDPWPLPRSRCRRSHSSGSIHSARRACFVYRHLCCAIMSARACGTSLQLPAHKAHKTSRRSAVLSQEICSVATYASLHTDEIRPETGGEGPLDEKDGVAVGVGAGGNLPIGGSVDACGIDYFA